ncbi:MAG: hypothetical protein KUG68_01830 [Flavobacteriaceae bacterium]|nr:hypothetical protein [Flavobacteriaceae bacterium]
MKTKITILTIALLVMTFTDSMAQTEIFESTNNSNEVHENIIKQSETIEAINNRQAAAELINYQAVARDAGGDLIINTAVTIDLEIRNGAGGTAVFTETHNPTTDDNGVFSLQIGSVNSLAAVNWLDIEAWLQVSLEGTDVGETQMGSVPTALHSRDSGQVMIYGSGTNNASKMIAQHSPAFPGWGVGYDDAGDDVTFMAGGAVNASVDLATGNISTNGAVEIALTTTSPALNRVYGNSMAIAYGSIDSVGGISTGYGISSVTNSATGVYEVVMDLDSNPANTVVTITPFTIGFGVPEICGYETTGANTFTVRIQDATGTARDSAFTFVVYGQ